MRVPSIVLLGAVLLTTPVLAQTPAPDADQAVGAVQKAVVRALNFGQGDLERLRGARADFTPAGWTAFMKHLDGFLDAKGAPAYTSSFAPSGGPTIITSTAQILLNVIYWKLDVQAAVAAPRVHHQWFPDPLMFEPELPRDVVENLEKRGQKPRELPKIGVANAVVRTARKLFVIGIADGATSMFVMDGEGRQITALEINVGRDLNVLRQTLRTALPNSQIEIKPAGDSILLVGSVPNASEATQAVDIANAFVGSSDKTASKGQQVSEQLGKARQKMARKGKDPGGEEEGSSPGNSGQKPAGPPQNNLQSLPMDAPPRLDTPGGKGPYQSPAMNRTLRDY